MKKLRGVTRRGFVINSNTHNPMLLDALFPLDVNSLNVPERFLIGPGVPPNDTCQLKTKIIVVN